MQRWERFVISLCRLFDEYVYGKELSPEDREIEDKVYKLMDMIFAENEEVYRIFEDAHLAFLIAHHNRLNVFLSN